MNFYTSGAVLPGGALSWSKRSMMRAAAAMPKLAVTITTEP